jgi:transcriptional regulator with XRE-family HTH domain
MMAKPRTRTYSPYSREAVQLLGQLVRQGRIEKQLTAQELSDRTGISRGLLQRIEKGDMNCQIGAYFEAAAIVGVQLFEVKSPRMSTQLEFTKDRLSLLPKYVRKSAGTLKDDF